MSLIDPTDSELDSLRSLGSFAGRRVIEIGAGDGRLAWPFAAEAALWLAVDNDGDELRTAANDLREQPLSPLRLLQADGRAQAVTSESFDVAFFTWSLCCIPHDGMAAALSEAGRVLRAGGLLLDIHPCPEPMRLEAWTALRPEAARNPPEAGDYRRAPLGALAADETLSDFKAASAALDGTGPGFEWQKSATFDYRYFFESLDDLTDYLEDSDELDLAGDDLLERALLAFSEAVTPAWLVLVQRVMVTSLRKR